MNGMVLRPIIQLVFPEMGEVFEESGVWNVLPQECPHTSLGYVGTIQKAIRGRVLLKHNEYDMIWVSECSR